MNTNIKKKIDIVNDIHELSLKSISTTIVEFKKITSLEIKFLRKELFEKDIKIKVLKNTLTKRAISNTKNEILTKHINGQIFIIFSEKEINLPIKILDKFIKKNANFKIKAICLYGEIYLENDIKKVINTPNKETAILNLISLLNKPLTNLNTVLNLIYENK
ncbi:MAG TPA: 50S ribosomal protein L10 [Candidatus Azoamicus sp. OHIO1]